MSKVENASPDFSGCTITDAIDAYVTAGNPMQVPHMEISAWIVNNDLFDVPFQDKLKQCDRMVADALKACTFTDPETGKSGRRYGCAIRPWLDHDTGEKSQKYLWDDMLNCNALFAHDAVRHMRKGIAKDCSSLADSVELWNGVNPNLRDDPIQISFDFTPDVSDDGK
jgi:hypothetical protein